MSNPVKQIVDSAGNVLSIVDYEARNIIAPAYSISRTYTVGEYCIYNNKMYKCTISVDTPGSFDPNNWSEITNSDELSELHSSLANTNTNLQNLITQIGAIHWLGVTNIYNFLRNTNNPIGLYLASCQTASDNPFNGSVTMALIFKASSNGNFSIVFLIAGNRLAISDQLGATQTALTWHSKVSPFG